MNKYIALFMSVLLLTACNNKQEQDITPVQTKVSKIIDFTGNVGAYTVQDLDEEDNLRTSILRNDDDNRPPYIYVTQASIGTGKNAQARWVVVGKGYAEGVDGFGGSYDSHKYGDIIKNADGTPHIRLYFKWRGSSKQFYKGQYGAMYLGGDYIDGNANKFVKQGYYRTNEHLTLVAEGSEVKMDVPLVTKAVKLNLSNEAEYDGTMTDTQFNVGRMSEDFEARGCLFALKFENTLDEDITIHSISAEEDDKIFDYKGYFSLEDILNNDRGEKYQAPFVGDNEDEREFFLYANEGATTSGIEIATKAVTDGRVYFWAYPKAGKENEAYKIRVTYALKSKPTKIWSSKIYKINAPTKTAGWEDGYCYRTTVKVDERPINPLSFVAETNLNTAGDGFGGTTADNSGFFSFSDAKAKAANFTEYILPEVKHIASIIPAGYTGDQVDFNYEKDKVKSFTQDSVFVGADIVRCLSDSQTIDGVVYSMRYKGLEKYASAWSYERDAQTGMITIKSVNVQKDTTLAEIIANKSKYFNSSYVVVRQFPALGYKFANMFFDKGSLASYWTSTKISFSQAYSFTGTADILEVKFDTQMYPFPVRLFKKEL